MTQPMPVPGDSVVCDFNPHAHPLIHSCRNPLRFVASGVSEVGADRAGGARGPGGMSARQPVARHPHTVMVPGRAMPDYWTSEGPYTVHGEPRPQGERWIGHRAGDGAHVLVLVPDSPTLPGVAPSAECPVYTARQETAGEPFGHWLVECDEGWRSTIVGSGMYEWAARWLVEQLQSRPYAPGARP